MVHVAGQRDSGCSIKQPVIGGYLRFAWKVAQQAGRGVDGGGEFAGRRVSAGAAGGLEQAGTAVTQSRAGELSELAGVGEAPGEGLLSGAELPQVAEGQAGQVAGSGYSGRAVAP